MMYSKMLRELFSDISLNVEDLLLLESFQVNYLPERVPQKEFAALIRKYPYIQDFLILKERSIAGFLKSLLEENEELKNDKLIAEYCDEAVWEIADLIAYNKLPELYDEKNNFNWTIDEITEKESLKEKIVADVGAGSGLLSFMLSEYAKTVFAVEPISSFRNYIRRKAAKKNCKNVYAIDGFLESIPLPDNTFDILFTSNAIGWNIEKELQEVERVVKPGGKAIHIMRVSEKLSENPVHQQLISGEWNYQFSRTSDENGLKQKYVKMIK